MSVHVYERVLQLLEAEGIKTLFGIPDPSFFNMFIRAEQRGWQVIAPHHEEAGAFMAEGLWRMTGTPGVVVGNQGPGVANLVPAAINAAKENAPVIFIGGQRAQIAAQRVRRGRIQYTHQYRYFEEAVKYVGVIQYPEQTDEIIREAFRQALSGTPGPVYIEIPMNAMQAELGELPPPAAPEQYRLVHQPANQQAIDAAAELIRRAQMPLLLIGQGAFTARAHDALAVLAHNLQSPVIHTYPVSSFLAGVEDRTFPCGFSPAGVEAIVNSDLVIAIGTEIGEPVHHGVAGHWAKGNTGRQWIHVESDPLSIGVNRHIDVPLVGDLRDIVPQLNAALKDTPRQRANAVDRWIEMHAEFKTAQRLAAPSGQDLIHPARLMVEATGAIPKDAVFVRDGGATSIYTWTYSQVSPKDSIWNQNFGHLGTGLPYAIGAQLAVGNDRRVVLISGDSAFLFHTSELETAVRKNLPVICIVASDYAWGVEVRGYRGMVGENSPETEAHWGKQVRLDKVAEGYGAHGEFVEREEDIAPAIARALASGKPAVIQIPIDPVANARDVPGHEEYSTWYNDFFY
ncbi:thiamine pyrophosphate-binding protein [Aestuariicella hydrocarbonica]|uniref:Thiamine pyrophosphate-binding protein n=1 Tax=Pseudomaricurvus hydrocarbonicus TaxID=1470433 RepID=A0A9E5MM14_9GAMM|nr:thiamine pyrophosphate-binding protein [Aestuariicella hydrocarbonica]NHO66008.1 thiamine pyrophosphate-binding protein [Aestuariicella hydrocarbonica]